jgi:hypothetical protein
MERADGKNMLAVLGYEEIPMSTPLVTDGDCRDCIENVTCKSINMTKPLNNCLNYDQQEPKSIPRAPLAFTRWGGTATEISLDDGDEIVSID